MRRCLFILLYLCVYNANAQIYYEDSYPEKELQSNLQHAKTPTEQIYAAGVLAIHYKKTFKDSLATIYLHRIYNLTASTRDKNLIAYALWWDAFSSSVYTGYNEYELGTAKANQLMQYAEQNKLFEEQIAANLLLCDINIHTSLKLAERYALTARQLLNNWKSDSTKKDSIKLEVFYRLSHAFIHKKDGVNIARYLLALHDYAEQDKNEALKIKAIFILARMYNEWSGQNREALLWRQRLCDYYIKKGQRSELVHDLNYLASSYAGTGNRELSKSYFKWSEKLRDSLGVYTLSMVLFNSANSPKQKLGLMTPQQFLGLLDNHFNGQIFLPPALTDKLKSEVFLKNHQLDSAGYYLSKAKKDKFDSLGKQFTGDYALLQAQYYLLKKKYSLSIEAYHVAIRESEQRGNQNLIETALKGLSEAYQNIKDYKTANDYTIQYYQFRDSLNSLNINEEITLMEMQKEKELQSAAFQVKQKEQKMRLYALLTGVIILVLLAGILFRNNRQRKKAYALLHKQKTKTEQTLQELKSTQAQLIQSEKMASLGQLTAGIAHEIQNPLNFVNNFSEINTELIAELKEEIERGDLEEVRAIAIGIEENEQKIIHHGKRADSIVKGMLQHSRASTGKKELTDINALVDECVRLSYHGMRAKDKEFNATIQTQFDESIGKINIVTQDISRVLLNLFNNAFYAVNEKKNKLNGAFEPAVSVCTKMLERKIEIQVQDNGNGIPQNIINKIFQPFFTTKPTGQGTGLGLSLSYDIIKAHGGEIKVESKEGEETDFIIQLPANNT